MFNLFKSMRSSSKRRGHATDRRAGEHQGPYVGKQPRARTLSGRWRKKNSSAGKKRGPRKSSGLFGF